ncbi:MAG: fructose-6-phosphate aldolase [Deltaproteobacteria bacterium]|nr:fructose-6-phosphate aldolase [Deltaproteobacteria bacterium]
MQFFIDTANIEEIKKYARMGIIQGVTTNPALIAKDCTGCADLKGVIKEICSIVNGPISAEVISTDTKGMVKEARMLSKLHKNIVVKIPAVPDGFAAADVLSREGIKTNVTILYTANQALVAAKVGATYVSPFIGRLDATSTDGIGLIDEIVRIYKNYGYKTKIIAASMRNPIYVKKAALSGADIATIPPDVLNQMMRSELTELGLKGFLDEWAKMPEKVRTCFTKGR